MRQIYADHAASAHPRPELVVQAMVEAASGSGNPGRSGHALSLHGARWIHRARTAVARLFSVAEPRRVVFTRSCTEALNLVIRGLAVPGCHMVTTSMEHNAVARTIRALERSIQLRVDVVRADGRGFVSPDRIADAVTGETRLVVLNHASNVSGALQDPEAVKEACGPVPLLLDAAQSAGVLPIRVDYEDLDYVCFSGHKGLLGPPGTGGICFGPDAPLPEPLSTGGTGSRSAEDEQPEILPDRFEPGTPNTPGLAGLAAAAEYILEQTLEKMEAEQKELIEAFLSGLGTGTGVHLYGPGGGSDRLAVFSIGVEGVDPGEAARRLESEFGILVRSGLHCAPWAHKSLGTFPEGSIRVSFGHGNTPDDAAYTADALRRLAGGAVR